jgi:hypothetical protein
MPGPGPRGPCQTYRAPCSRFRDSRFLARNPRKPGNSRAARGTRTRQPGTRSTTDGLLCGEIASAAERNPAHGPRSPALDPRVCQIEMQTPRSSSSSSSSPGSDPPASRHWFPGSDPPASIPETSFQIAGSSSWHRRQRAGAPAYRVILLEKSTGCRSPPPAGPHAGRRCHGPCF